MKHAAQNRNYGRPFNGRTLSPFETRLTGRYAVEKLIEGVWTAMSHGDATEGLDRLIRCAEACGGEVRIVRRKDNAIVFSRKSSQELSAFDANEREI